MRREDIKDRESKGSKLVEKKRETYSSRYGEELAPESKIVEGPYKATYKSRYK